MDVVVQFAGSAVAIALLVAFVARTRRNREPAAGSQPDWKARFAEEFPGSAVEELWVAKDGSAALAHAGDLALIGWRLGDGVVVRSAAFSHLKTVRRGEGRVELRLDDPGLPPLRFAADDGAWPPGDWTARLSGATNPSS